MAELTSPNKEVQDTSDGKVLLDSAPQEPSKETEPLFAQVDETDIFESEDLLDIDSVIPKPQMPEKMAGTLAGHLAFMGGKDTFDSYDIIKDSLIQEGSHDSVDSTRNEIIEARKQADAATLDNILMSQQLTPDERLQEINLLYDDIAKRQDVNIHDYIKYKLAEREKVDNALAGQSRISLMKAAQMELASNETIQRQMNAAILNNDAGMLSLFGGVVGSAIPGLAWELKNSLAEADPELSSFWYNVLPGEALFRFTQRIQTADPETKTKMVNAFIKAAESESAKWLDTDVSEFDQLMALEAALDPKNPHPNILRHIYNLVGILDASVVGAPLGKLLLKGVSRNTIRTVSNTTMDLLNRYAPNDAAKAAKAAVLDSTGETARKLGTKPENILADSVFPRTATEDIRATPDLLNPLAKEALKVLQDAKVGKIDHIMAETEAAAMLSERTAALEAAKTGGIEHISKAAYVRTETGITSEHVIAMSDELGYTNIHMLKDQMENWPQAKLGKVEYLRKSVDGKYYPIEEAVGPQFVDDYVAKLSINEEFLPRHAIQPLERPKNVLPGHWAKLLNISSQFLPRDVISAGVASAYKDNERKMIVKVMEPYSSRRKSSPKDIVAVNYVLGLEDDLGKEFTKEAVQVMLNNKPSAIAAYNAARITNYIDYFTKNAALRRQWKSDGFKTITTGDTSATIAKPLTEAQATSAKVALDPATGLKQELTPEGIEKLYKEGGQIGEMKWLHDFEKESTPYIIIRPGESTVGELTPYVLEYRPGHIKKNYEATHAIIEKFKTTVNGTPGITRTRVLKMATGSKQAEAAKAELLAKYPNKDINYRLLAELESQDEPLLNGYKSRTADQYYADNKQVWYAKPRGEEIEHVSGNRYLTDIPTSLIQAREVASRLGHLQPYIEAQINRYNVTFEKAFGKFDPYDSPKQAKGMTPEEISLVKEAQAWHDRIRLDMGMDMTKAAEAQRKLFIWAADKIANVSNTKVVTFLKGDKLATDLSLLLLHNRERGITGALSALAFIKGIALYPARQLLMQAQSSSVYLSIEHGMKYAASSRSWKEAEAVLEGLLTKYVDDPVVWNNRAPILAKSLNMTVKDLDELVDTVRINTAVIDSHQVLDKFATDARTVIGSSKIFRGTESAFNFIKGGADISRRYGFSAGETINKLSAFLAVRNKYMVNNPGKHWTKFKNEIIGETEARTGSMNDLGRTYMQTGIWRLAFQFMNYNSRALQQIMPNLDTKIPFINVPIGAFSDKTWSSMERKRLVTSQLAIYGLAGLGIKEWYDEAKVKAGIETDHPVVEEIVTDGLMGMAMDMAFRAADAENERTSLSFSSNFAPFSAAAPISIGGRAYATGYYGVARDFLEVFGIVDDDGKNMLKDSPGISMLTRAYDWAKVGVILAGATDAPPLDDIEGFKDWITRDAQTWINHIGGIIPQYNNALVGRLAMREGFIRDRFGRPIVETTRGEALAFSLFGIRSDNSDAYFDIRQEIFDRFGSNAVMADEDLQKTAKDLYKNVMKVTSMLNKNEEGTNKTEFKDLLSKHFEYIKLTHSYDEYHQIMKYFTQQRFADIDQTGSSKLGALVVKAMGLNTDPYDEMYTRIMNLPKTFKDKDKYVRIIEMMRAERDDALTWGSGKGN